jgi:transposase
MECPICRFTNPIDNADRCPLCRLVVWIDRQVKARDKETDQCRFNVLGAWNAVTRELLTITNTTVVNTDTMCDLLRVVATRGLAGPVTLVLDNARYQRNALVMGLAQELGIELLFLPSYSPNLNLIERLWRFVKRKAAYGRYHPTFAEFRAAVRDVIDRVPTTHTEQLASLMTLNFQEFDDVSLLAA